MFYAPAYAGVGLDTGFGTAGYFSVPLKQAYQGEHPDILVQPDGKILAASPDPTDASAWRLIRVNESGGLDTSFGTAGVVSTSFAGSTMTRATGVGLQPDGKIVVVGTVDGGTQVYNDWAIARYHANGSLDTSFGNGGTLRMEFAGMGAKLYDVECLA